MSKRTFIIAIQVEDWPSNYTEDMASFIDSRFAAYNLQQALHGEPAEGKLADVTVWQDLESLKADEEGHHLEDWVAERFDGDGEV